jgi:hypothetical protein
VLRALALALLRDAMQLVAACNLLGDSAETVQGSMLVLARAAWRITGFKYIPMAADSSREL